MITLTELEAAEDQVVEVSLAQRRSDRRQRVGLCLDGGPVHSEALIDLTTVEAGGVAQILRMLGRVR
jgi:hypothetical protein